MDVIGLGHCGCSVAEKFKQYPQYNIYFLDTEDWTKKGASWVFDKHAKPEEYEANCPDLKMFFDGLGSDVLFIVGGSGMISGASLRILEQIKEIGCNISVLYVQPNIEFLMGADKLQERLTFGVLQQYARSGVFERLYLVNNVSVEECLEEITVSEYFNVLNEAIASTLHMINVWRNVEPVMGNLVEPAVTDRISTFGVMDVITGEEKIFFPLERVTDKNIFYAINQNSLKKEGKLHGQIRKQIKEKMEDGNQVSFGIYPTDYEGSQAYVLAHTKIVQGEG